jgi:hypothetical protein
MKRECVDTKIIFGAERTASGKNLLLLSTTKDIFMRDGVGNVPNLWVNLADGTDSSSEKHKLITASINCHSSPFVSCLVYDKRKIEFMPNCKQTELNKQH